MIFFVTHISPLAEHGNTLSLKLTNGIRVEEIDGEAIVLDPSGSVIHRATGDAVEVLALAALGVADSDIPAHFADAIASLTHAGVIARSGWTRRQMLLATGVGAVGGGLASFALATPAHALSVCPPGTPATNPGTFNSSNTFWTGPGVTSVTVRAWGGGGGGGGENGMSGSGGGGGGAYAASAVTVAECMSYSIVVGSGGSGGGSRVNGGNGGNSSFNLSALVANGGMGGISGGVGGAGGTAGTFAGGAGASGSGMAGGGGGGSGGAGSAGGPGSGSTGGTAGGGTPPGAAGGTGGTGGAVGAGIAPGGGGGGEADMGVSGGPGASGRVIVIVP